MRVPAGLALIATIGKQIGKRTWTCPGPPTRQTYPSCLRYGRREVVACRSLALALGWMNGLAGNRPHTRSPGGRSVPTAPLRTGQRYADSGGVRHDDVVELV